MPCSTLWLYFVIYSDGSNKDHKVKTHSPWNNHFVFFGFFEPKLTYIALSDGLS